MSAPDAPTAWNLRCEVREKLIEFIQKKYPDRLPKVRAEIQELVLPAHGIKKLIPHTKGMRENFRRLVGGR